jgi:hypothetical protein
MITDRTELRGFSGSLAAIDGWTAHELSSALALALAFVADLASLSVLASATPVGY